MKKKLIDLSYFPYIAIASVFFYSLVFPGYRNQTVLSMLFSSFPLNYPFDMGVYSGSLLVRYARYIDLAVMLPLYILFAGFIIARIPKREENGKKLLPIAGFLAFLLILGAAFYVNYDEILTRGKYAKEPFDNCVKFDRNTTVPFRLGEIMSEKAQWGEPRTINLSEAEAAELEPFYKFHISAGYVLCYENASLFGMKGKMYYFAESDDGATPEESYMHSWLFVCSGQSDYDGYKAVLAKLREEYPKGVCAQKMKKNKEVVSALTLWEVPKTYMCDACGYYNQNKEGLIYFACTSSNNFASDRDAGNEMIRLYLEKL